MCVAQMKAFELLDEQNVSALAVISDDGKLVGQVDADSLKLIGVQFSMLAKPLWEVWEINGTPKAQCVATHCTVSYVAHSGHFGCRCPIHARRWNTTELHDKRGAGPVTMRGTCTLDSTMEEMVRTVVEGHFRRLWVVDAEGKAIGVISLTDLIKAVINRLEMKSVAVQ